MRFWLLVKRAYLALLQKARRVHEPFEPFPRELAQAPGGWTTMVACFLVSLRYTFFRGEFMSNKPEEIRANLAEAREELLAVVAEVEEGGWETAVFSESSAWQLIDLLRHVVDSEASMTGLMVRIRDGGEGVPADFDLDRWNARRVEKLQTKTRDDLLADMGQNRANLLSFMDSLAEADWAKQGRHGSGRIMSLAEICQIIADHERLHAQDFRAALEK
jgi:hypothetical protein